MPDASRAHATRARHLLATCAVFILLAALPSAAGAVVPNFTLSSPTEGQHVNGSLAFNGYSSNVGIDATCHLPNLAPYSTSSGCTYNGNWVSTGFSLSPNLPEGTYTASVTAVATDGSNQSVTISRQIVVDKTGPTTQITNGPRNGASLPGSNFQWEFSANEASTFECKFDGEEWADCASPYSRNGIDDGSHTLRVRGKDATYPWGNLGGDAVANFSVNNSPPLAQLTSVGGAPVSAGVTNYVASVDLSWGLAATRDDALLECSLDEGLWQSCSTLTGFSTTGLTEGQHTLDVRAFLVGPASIQDPPVRSIVVVDTVAPVVSFAGVPQHFAGSDVTIDWSADEVLGGSACNLDGVHFDPCPTSFASLAGGAHELVVGVKDRAGNWSSDTSFNFRTYPGAPDTTITPAQQSHTAVEAASFTLSSSAIGSTFECRVDAEAFKPCTSPTSVAAGSHAAGSHVFEARAIDPAEQVDATPASTAFTLAAVVGAAPVPAVSGLTGKGKRLSLTLSAPGKISARVAVCKRKRRGHDTICKKYTSGSATASAAGKLKIKLRRSLKRGVRYKVTLIAASTAGVKQSKVHTIKAK